MECLKDEYHSGLWSKSETTCSVTVHEYTHEMITNADVSKMAAVISCGQEVTP